MPDFASFQAGVLSRCSQELLPKTRIHPIKSFSNSLARVYLKREDEVGYAISGNKLRKYASLLPWLKQEGIEVVHALGGSHSNNLVSLAQVFNEHDIDYHFYMRTARSDRRSINQRLMRTLVNSDRIHMIDGPEWVHAEQIVSEIAEQSERTAFVLREGAVCPAALPGAMTLGLELIASEVGWDHIFIDAGTGLSAAGLLLAFSMQEEYRPKIHILTMAELVEPMQKRIAEYASWARQLFGWEFPLEHYPYEVVRPRLGASFGSVASRIKRLIVDFARAEGVLTEPLYSAKLLYHVRHEVNIEQMRGNILCIHSGGTQVLTGFLG